MCGTKWGTRGCGTGCRLLNCCFNSLPCAPWTAPWTAPPPPALRLPWPRQGPPKIPRSPTTSAAAACSVQPWREKKNAAWRWFGWRGGLDRRLRARVRVHVRVRVRGEPTAPSRTHAPGLALKGRGPRRASSATSHPATLLVSCRMHTNVRAKWRSAVGEGQGGASCTHVRTCSLFSIVVQGGGVLRPGADLWPRRVIRLPLRRQGRGEHLPLLLLVPLPHPLRGSRRLPAPTPGAFWPPLRPCRSRLVVGCGGWHTRGSTAPVWHVRSPRTVRFIHPSSTHVRVHAGQDGRGRHGC